MATKSTKTNFTLQTIRNNSVYFGGYLVVLIIGFWVSAQLAPGEESLYFVQFRNSIWDVLASYSSQLAEPIAIAFLIGYLVFKNYRKALSLLAAMALMLITAGLTKIYFHHERPALFFRNLGRLDELVPVAGNEILTGDTSFPSGHTMAAFTIFTLFALYSKQKTIPGVFFLLLAISVALSRIYLGHHFLIDVLAGSLFGVVIALLMFFLFDKLRYRPKWNQGLILLGKRKKP